jgi:Skp1 family, tetramerisation domain.
MIKLTTGQVLFELPILSATKSGLLKNIIEDCGTDETIPLETISSQTLTKIIEYLNQNLSDNNFNQKVESNDIKKYVSL